MGERLLLVFMIDALGYRMVSETRSFAFLEAPDGPIRSVCGYSSACIPSLLTGRLPCEHGQWAMYLRDPQHSVFRGDRVWIRLFAGLLRRPGFTRRLVARRTARRVSGYFSLYDIPPRLLPQLDLCQKRDIFAPGAIAEHPTPFDAARERQLPLRVWDWRGTEDRRRAELAAEIRAGRRAMLFFYSPALDALGHARGTRTEEFRGGLADCADFVREMLALAQRSYREVRVLVFGDHGMADVTGVHDLLGELRALALRMPEDALYFLDSTMARFWFARPELRAPMLARLEGKTYGRVLGDDECRQLGILFPDRRYGEVIFLMHPGEILVPSFMGTTAPRAMHGYHPDHEDSDTILLANFPHAAVRSILEIGPLLVREIARLGGGEADPVPAPEAS